MRIAVYLFAIVLLQFSCDKKNQDLIEFIEVDLGPCYGLSDQQHVVHDQASYDALGDLLLRADALDCEDAMLPEVDFEQYDLLGIQACGSGCDRKFEKTVSQDDALKQILYQVEVKETGLCEPWVCSMNWILIDKVPSGYTVTFKVD